MPSDLTNDFEQTQRFLSALGGNGFSQCLWTLQVFSDRGEKGRAWNCACRDIRDVLHKLDRAQKDGCGVFVTVNECADEGRTKDNVIKVRAVFVDLDGAPLDPVLNCRLKPHIIVASGGPGRYHAYWKVDGLALDEFTPVQEVLAGRFGGDETIKDLPRVMRLPGFWHQKADPVLVTIQSIADHPAYTRDEILAEFPVAVKEKPQRKTTAARVVANGSAYLTKALNGELAAVRSAQEKRRNHTLNKSAFNLGQLLAAGLDETVVRNELYAAAMDVGLGEAETLATIQSGLTKGVANPRGIPDKKSTSSWDTTRAKHTATNGTADQAKQDVADEEKDTRPEIFVRKGALGPLTADAVRAMKAAKIEVYNRGGMLVRPVCITSMTAQGISRPDGATVLVPVDEAWMRLAMSESAKWLKHDARSDEWVPCDPPRDIAEIVVTSPDVARFAPLVCVAKHPVLLADGRRIARRGYDARSGIYLDVSGEWPGVPDRPTLSQAKAALETIQETFRFFTWETRTDFAVAISMLATVVMRPSMDTAPMFGVDAPTRGSGKSLLVDAASILGTGVPASCCEHSSDDVEFAKRLDGMLLAGDALIAIDNVEGPLEGAALCSTVTQLERRIRPLGSSRMVTIPCTALLIANGNNLICRGDLCRRVLKARISPKCERPELRHIEQDLLAEVRSRRGELVAALQTIAKAYIAAGSPDLGINPYGGFRQWDRLVRNAVVWVGCADPLDSLAVLHEEDPARQVLTSILETWYAVFGSEPTTSSRAIEASRSRPDLRAALGAVATVRGDLDAAKLGYWLRQNRDTMSGELTLVRGAKLNTGYPWRVLKVGAHGAHGAHASYSARKTVS